MAIKIQRFAVPVKAAFSLKHGRSTITAINLIGHAGGVSLERLGTVIRITPAVIASH
ncbi:MAG: hypothetical protein K6C08_03865 [Oscillospiraceae bacterium]|nr:hypothetical protein [Oscillospiraceae bacterium]